MPDAGRVIAGRARGIRLVGPGPGTRPIGDRVKQTLFAILEADLRGAAFLDLFAGSGAGGIEALSRGAALAVFVESDRGAVAAIGENLRRTGLAGPAAVIRRQDALTFLRGAVMARDGSGDGRRAGADGEGRRGGAGGEGRRPDAAGGDAGAGGPFRVVLLDPPYAERDVLAAALAILGAQEAVGRLVVPGGRVVAKHSWREAPPERVGLLASERERRFGETSLTFYRVGTEGSV